MKLCFINTNIAWGGGEKWHYSKAVMLKKAGFDISFIVFPESKLHQKLKNSDFKIILLRVNKLSFLNLFLINKVKSVFKRNKFDTVILNLPQDVKIFAKIAFQAKVQKVIYRRGMDHPIKASFFNKRIYPNYITHFIANSERVKEAIYKNFPNLEKKIKIIYNGVSLKEIPPLKPLSSKLILGNLARLVEQKGHKYFIPLAKQLKDYGLNFEIHIAGAGPLRESLEKLIEENSLAKEIKILGHRDSYEFLKTIDFFVLPSLFEGLSNSLLEAQLFRKPTFAFDISSNREIIENDKNGYIVKGFDVDKMARQIVSLWSNSEKQALIQKACISKLKKKFNEDQLNKQLVEYINE